MKIEKIHNVLSQVLPEDKAAQVTDSIKKMMESYYRKLEKEFNKKLHEAYTQLEEEKRQAELIAEQGYEQAYEIICSLMQRLDEQREEFKKTLYEGYEEAYQTILKERRKAEKLETELYEEYDKKLQQIKEYMVDKLDQFLEAQEVELYEAAKRELLNDPTVAEYRVALAKVAEVLSEYMHNDDFDGVATQKLEDALKQIEDLRSQMRILEARNTRLAAENHRLNEQVARARKLMTESTRQARKAKASKKKAISGRGHQVLNEDILLEHGLPSSSKPKQDDAGRSSSQQDPLNDLLVLSGVQPTN